MEKQLICGITGKVFEKGDLVLIQKIEPEEEGQLPYTRYVRAEVVLDEEALISAQENGTVVVFE